MNRKRFAIGVALSAGVLLIVLSLHLIGRSSNIADPPIADGAALISESTQAARAALPRQAAGEAEGSRNNLAMEDDSGCEWVAIVPDYPEFEVSSCRELGAAAAAFAAEAEDPVWALSTEAAIRALVADNDMSEFADTAVDCRQTSCGVLLLWPSDTSPGDALARTLNLEMQRLNNNVIAQEGFGGRMGFSGTLIRGGRRVGVIYFMEAQDRARYSQPQQSPRIVPTLSSSPALPGLSGVIVSFPPMGGPNRLNAGEMLAAEPDDPSWARAMESQIIGEIAQSVDLAFSQLQVECRTTQCGLVFFSTEGSVGSSDLQLLHVRLQSELGLRHVGTGFGSGGGQLIYAEYFQLSDRAEPQ